MILSFKDEVGINNTLTRIFTVECELCRNGFSRKESIGSTSPGFQLSNTDAALCKKCEERFIEYLRKIDVIKFDCWCKHIQEFVNANK